MDTLPEGFTTALALISLTDKPFQESEKVLWEKPLEKIVNELQKYYQEKNLTSTKIPITISYIFTQKTELEDESVHREQKIEAKNHYRQVGKYFEWIRKDLFLEDKPRMGNLEFENDEEHFTYRITFGYAQYDSDGYVDIIDAFSRLVFNENDFVNDVETISVEIPLETQILKETIHQNNSNSYEPSKQILA